jgi:anti-sigma factor RsiW
MSCSPFDLRDYVLAELGESERRSVEEHALGCAACREELERLRLTQTALLCVADEEIPQRVAFVSDKVFDPSPWRRYWALFWASSARVAFAASAMLVIAAFLWNRPAPVVVSPPAPGIDLARLEREFDARVQAAVARAVAESEARQEKNNAETLRAVEKRYEMDRKALMLAMDENLSLLQMRMGTMVLASGGAGGDRP